MPNLSAHAMTYAQLEALWINNGGSRSMAPLMAAIAMAESSGIPTNVNPRDNNGRQTSWGLWQISDGTHNMPVANILDPNVNAQQAVRKFKTQGLGAWGTYTSGAYREYLKHGVNPDANIPATGSTSTATPASLTGDIGSAIGEGFGMAFRAVLQPIIATSIWAGEILLGVGLIVGGMILFAMNTDAGKRVTGEAASLAGTAATAALPEVAPEAALATRLRTRQGRQAYVREQARKTARKRAQAGKPPAEGVKSGRRATGNRKSESG